MALLGPQIVITMVIATIFSKVSLHYSFARWLLCQTGLIYYICPSDDSLKIAAGLSKSKTENGSRSQGKSNAKAENSKNNKKAHDGTFNIPKFTELNLETLEISESEAVNLKFYPDYQWLLDFSLCSILVYTLSEAHMYVMAPKEELSLSSFWCFLVLLFSLKTMLAITLVFFRGIDSSSEKMIVILSFFVYLFIAFGLLAASEENLDFSLESAYSSLNQSVSSFVAAKKLPSPGPISKFAFMTTIAFVSALIGAFCTFPGLRFGRMHWDSLRIYEDSKIRTLLLHLSFLSPILIVFLWIRPVGRRYFTEIILMNYSRPLMPSSMFETMRLCVVVVVSLLRISLMPVYLQSYLNLARVRLESIRNEAGKISNKQIQLMVSRVFYYLCVVSLQYIIPVLLSIFFALMCKTLGGYQWIDVLKPDPSAKCDIEDELFTDSFVADLSQASTVSQATKSLSLSLKEIRKIFRPIFYQGVLGFFTWWSVFAGLLSSLFGVLYHSYFTK